MATTVRRIVACAAIALLTACGGKGGSGSDPIDADADGSLLDDAGGGSDADQDGADADETDADADETDADADETDTDAADSGDAGDGDADDADDDATDATDADDTDVEDAIDATDALDTTDTVETSDTPDAADTTDTDTGVEPDPAMIKLVDPNATPTAWYVDGAFGTAADIDGDLFAVTAPEDNQRGAKAGAIVIGTRAGDRWTTERVAPPELNAGDRFGTAVAISGRRLLVGAGEDSTDEPFAGAAHVLEQVDGAWQVTATFRARTPRSNGAYGQAVALDGGIAVVGGWTPDAGSGVVELWNDTGAGWERFLVLDAPSGEAENQFGTAVAAAGGIIAVSDPSEPAVYVYRAPFDSEPIRVEGGTVADSWGTALGFDGEWLAIGAFGGLVEGERSGSVWLYRITDFETPEAVLAPAELENGARFGFGVDVDGDELVVGAYRAETLANRSGIAYRYLRSEAGEWELEETLLPDTLVSGDRFGIATAIDGGTILSTAVRDDTISEDAGAAYLYDRTADLSPPPRRLFAGDPAAGDAFGTSVATDGRWIVVGAPFDDAAGADAGAAHVFERAGAGVRYAGRLPHDSGSDDQGFGMAVAIEGDWIAVGAPSDDELGSNVGAVFTFRFDGSDWQPAGRIRAPGAADNGDFGARLDLSGSTLIIGAPARTDEVGSGGVWLYRRGEGDVWVYVSRLDATERDLRPGPDEPAEMGASVLAAGTLFMAGAPAQDSASGAAYTWAYSGGPPGALLPTRLTDMPADARFGSSLASNGGDVFVGAEGQSAVYPLLPGDATSFPGTPIESPEENDRFGAALGFAGPSVLVVGAPGAAVRGDAAAGRLWVYDAAFDGWSDTPRSYDAPDATPGLQLGATVSGAGGLVVAGAAGDDERGAEAGAAWVVIEP